MTLQKKNISRFFIYFTLLFMVATTFYLAKHYVEPGTSKVEIMMNVKEIDSTKNFTARQKIKIVLNNDNINNKNEYSGSKRLPKLKNIENIYLGNVPLVENKVMVNLHRNEDVKVQFYRFFNNSNSYKVYDEYYLTNEAIHLNDLENYESLLANDDSSILELANAYYEAMNKTV